MKNSNTGFAPLEWDEAEQLNKKINDASRRKKPLVINPGEGIDVSASPSLLSSMEGTNALVRFGRHYQRTNI